MIKSTYTRAAGAVLTMMLGLGMTGCPNPAPPPNLPPPEYEAPRKLDEPTPLPQDEDWPPAAAEPAPMPEAPIAPAEQDAGADDGSTSTTEAGNIESN